MSMINERLLPLRKLIDVVEEAAGIRLHVSTLHRWITRGVRGHKLPATRLGGRWLASAASVQQFCSARNSNPETSITGTSDIQTRLADEFNM